MRRKDLKEKAMGLWGSGVKGENLFYEEAHQVSLRDAYSIRKNYRLSLGRYERQRQSLSRTRAGFLIYYSCKNFNSLFLRVIFKNLLSSVNNLLISGLLSA